MARFGIQGHQPAIAALCKINKEEKEGITGDLLRQKVGSNPKNIKAYQELMERRRRLDATTDEKGKAEPTRAKQIRVRRARLAMGTTVRWKRVRKQESVEEMEVDTGAQQEVRNYKTRILKCTRCEAPQETVWMQLRTKVGYRGIHCKECGKQELCSRNLCQCGQLWHQCTVHRVDPQTHSSRRGKKGVRRGKSSVGKVKVRKKV